MTETQDEIKQMSEIEVKKQAGEVVLEQTLGFGLLLLLKVEKQPREVEKRIIVEEHHLAWD